VDGVDDVRAARVHRRHLPEEPALAAVRALVQDEPRLAGDDPSVPHRAGLELHDDALAALSDRAELLLAGEHELDRSLGGTSERRDLALEVQIALGAEAPAEERHDHADVGLGHLQGLGHTGSRRVGHLRRGPDGDLVALPLRDDGARLDRDALRRVGDIAALDDDVGGRHRRVGVPLDDRVIRHRVAVRDDVLVLVVGREIGMDERGPRLHRLLEIGDRGQRLVVDLDQAGGLGGDLGRERRDTGDDLALEAHDVLGEQVSILHEGAEAHVGQLVLRHDRDDAGQGARLRGVDAQDARVRVIRVAEPRVRHTGEIEVGRVPAGARDLLLAVRTNEARHGLDGCHSEALLPLVAHPTVRAAATRGRGRPEGREAFGVSRSVRPGRR
jgi:hypothetical protein